MRRTGLTHPSSAYSETDRLAECTVEYIVEYIVECTVEYIVE